MSATVGDEASLRRRKAEKEHEKKEMAKEDAGEEDEVDPATQEYIDYFKQKYGENPRTDIFGIDGCGLFVLIYIVVAGVIFTIIFMSVYARQRDLFHKMPSLK
eukprot:TRINITY_DN5031_c0_g1_i1.p1 TRINITY_DN5031_c0_g1~~TRINITY_DN5031_c0_g1_i1.p1  ORF type:complete len:103 (+),score=31.32 TRINITY_DN5031_c0_g1_i1:65-373(+)